MAKPLFFNRDILCQLPLILPFLWQTVCAPCLCRYILQTQYAINTGDHHIRMWQVWLQASVAVVIVVVCHPVPQRCRRAPCAFESWECGINGMWYVGLPGFVRVSAIVRRVRFDSRFDLFWSRKWQQLRSTYVLCGVLGGHLEIDIGFGGGWLGVAPIKLIWISTDQLRSNWTADDWLHVKYDVLVLLGIP